MSFGPSVTGSINAYIDIPGLIQQIGTTGFVTNPLSADLDCATTYAVKDASLVSATEVETEIVALPPGSLATAIAVNDDLKMADTKNIRFAGLAGAITANDANRTIASVTNIGAPGESYTYANGGLLFEPALATLKVNPPSIPMPVPVGGGLSIHGSILADGIPAAGAPNANVLGYNPTTGVIEYQAAGGGGGGNVNNPMTANLNGGGYNITNVQQLGVNQITDGGGGSIQVVPSVSFISGGAYSFPNACPSTAQPPINADSLTNKLYVDNSLIGVVKSPLTANIDCSGAYGLSNADYVSSDQVGTNKLSLPPTTLYTQVEVKDDLLFDTGKVLSFAGDAVVTGFGSGRVVAQGLQLNTPFEAYTYANGAISYELNGGKVKMTVPAAVSPNTNILGYNYITNEVEFQAAGGGSVAPLSYTYYVAKNGNDSTGNGSIAAPFLTIQKAIDVAEAAVVPNVTLEVIVAAGVYTENLVLKTGYLTLTGVSQSAENSNGTQLIGTINIAATGGSSLYSKIFAVQGFSIRQTTGSQPTISDTTSATEHSVIFSDCKIQALNRGVFLASGAQTRNYFVRCQIQHSAVGAFTDPLFEAGGTGTWLTLYQCDLYSQMPQCDVLTFSGTSYPYRIAFCNLISGSTSGIANPIIRYATTQTAVGNIGQCAIVYESSALKSGNQPTSTGILFDTGSFTYPLTPVLQLIQNIFILNGLTSTAQFCVTKTSAMGGGQVPVLLRYANGTAYSLASKIQSGIVHLDYNVLS